MKIKQKYTIFILEQHPAAPICPQDGKMLMHMMNHSGENLCTRSGLFFLHIYLLFGKPGFQNTYKQIYWSIINYDWFFSLQKSVPIRVKSFIHLKVRTD